jgi:hypothetical protein
MLLPNDQLGFAFEGDNTPIVFGHVQRAGDGGQLEFHFNQQASCDMVEALLQQIAYQCDPRQVRQGSCRIRFALSDGSGVTSQSSSLTLRFRTPPAPQENLAVAGT